MAEYVDSRGGEAALGVGYQTLLKAAAPARLIVEHVGGILLARPSWIVNRRKRQLSQLAKDYLAALKHLRETLVVLGLDRVARPVDPMRRLEEAVARANAEREAREAATSLPTHVAAPGCAGEASVEARDGDEASDARGTAGNRFFGGSGEQP
jgi:hypothetical protein